MINFATTVNRYTRRLAAGRFGADHPGEEVGR